VNYTEASAIAQAMKAQARMGSCWEGLPASTRESLDQIMTAIGRTVSGSGHHHWDGIIEFAQAAKPADLGTFAPEPEFRPTRTQSEPATTELERSIRHEVITKLRGEPSEGR
jgi:hypothetical protein